MAPKRRRRSARKTKRTFFIPQSFPESVQNHMHFLIQWSSFLLVYSKTGKARKTKRKARRKSKRKARKGKKATKKKSRRRRRKKKVVAAE